MGKPLYLTTTLPYVNADPHIGFALEIVQADIYARYRALLGDEVFFNTGTDEHGLKIYQKAKESGKDTQQYVDEYAEKFRGLKERLGLSDDVHFIRTTDARHKAAAQEMWRRCAAKGDIEKRTYKGLYCVGDEAFLKESDLVGGKCPNHPTMDPIEIEEENYFFKLSNYQQEILGYLNKEGVVVPEWRRQEAIQFVERGLEDFSISRVKEKMPWGVPVPGDESQVMYVWFDALTNYISTLGWPDESAGSEFETFWKHGEVMQMAGKDQVRFQSIMWQAMLMSAGVKNTDKVIYHGFITSGGQKMSKSIGNVIDPYAIVAEYGTDALRYFLARHVHPFDDSDVTMERFKEAYNADLANGLGNVIARVMKLAQTHLTEPVQLPLDVKRFVPGFTELINTYDLNKACETLWSHIEKVDKIMQLEQPFKQLKSEDESIRQLGQKNVTEQVIWLARIANHLQPIMPMTSKKILSAVGDNVMPENLFPRKD